MSYLEGLTVLADMVKFGCECEFQLEASEKSCDLIQSAITPLPIHPTNLDKTLVEH